MKIRDLPLKMSWTSVSSNMKISTWFLLASKQFRISTDFFILLFSMTCLISSFVSWHVSWFIFIEQSSPCSFIHFCFTIHTLSFFVLLLYFSSPTIFNHSFYFEFKIHFSGVFFSSLFLKLSSENFLVFIWSFLFFVYFFSQVWLNVCQYTWVKEETKMEKKFFYF